MNKQCEYEGCKHAAVIGRDLCIFHLPADDKGISVEEFNNEIIKKLDSKDYNFVGFIFPGHIDFGGHHFTKGVLFTGAQFFGETDFSRSEFQFSVSFGQAIFKGELIKFDSTVFSGYIVSFNKCKFECNELSFTNTKFTCDTISFGNSIFHNIDLKFHLCNFDYGLFNLSRTVFHNCKLSFSLCKFEGNSLLFSKSKINAGSFEISDCQFKTSFKFINTLIGAMLKFNRVTFHNESACFLQNLNLIDNKKIVSKICFDYVTFCPQTYFEFIGDYKKQRDENNNIDYHSKPPVILFRYSFLKDVVFSNCDMNLFSFFSSHGYENAHIDMSKLKDVPRKIFKYFPIKYKNKCTILDDIIYREKRKIPDSQRLNEFVKYYEIEGMERYWDVSDIYLKFKTSADNEKNYRPASWFYFNEYEMRRLHLIDRIKRQETRQSRVLSSIKPTRVWLYFFYKLFAGYGEKPLWSLNWLILSSVGFSIYYMFAGIVAPGDETIKYVWEYKVANTWDYIINFEFSKITDFAGDLLYTMLLSISTIIPKNYRPFDFDGFKLLTEGRTETIVSIANPIVLIIFIIFIAIGLKRHFRRF